MKLVALLTPAAMLAPLWALQRLEVWITHDPGPSPGSAGRSPTSRPPARRPGLGKRRGDHD